MATETRTIRTVLELNATRFNQGAASAAASAKNLAGELGRITDAQGQHHADYDRVANSLLGIGAAAAAGLGLAAKASMDWESAWAGVTKTIEGTPAQLSAVEDGLRGLARELPASHQEIAAVAEAAGALGVQTDSVVDFTRTMVNLGETTNLSADEAATSLARFSNIMGTSQDDVDRLGAALVGLGNAGASTEQEIMQMGLRLAGVGAQVGLTEGEVLGLANAMSSVGIEAEAGGTAMSMGMRKIQSAVDEGGDKLAGFAEVAGMTSEEFARLWNADAAAGLDAFVQGLARVGSEGGNVSTVLEDLGMKGIRESDTFLRLAGASDMLSASLAQGNEEFEKNLALTVEAAKRYETTESRIQIAKNALVDAGIDLGANVLPVLADVAGSAADLATAFSNLPAPLQQSVTVLGTVAGASALLAGGLMRTVPAAMETIAAFKRIRTEAPGVTSAMGKVAKGVGVATAAFTAASLISAYGDSLTDFSLGANEAADAAMRLADANDPMRTVFKDMGMDTSLASASTKELAADLKILADGHWYEGISNMETGIRNAFGAGLATTDDLRARLGEVGQGLAALTQTDLPAAQESFTALWDAAGGSEEAGADLLDLMPALRDELVGMANAAGLATDDSTLLKLATGELVPPVKDATGATGEYTAGQEDATGAVEDHVAALDELQDRLEDTANLLLGTRGAARDYESAVRDAAEAAKENGKNLDITTEKGAANEAALDSIADAAHNLANEQREAGATQGELARTMTDARKDFIDTAVSMGMGADEAERLADELQLIPGDYMAMITVDNSEAKVVIDDTVEGFHGVVSMEPHVDITADASTAVISAEQAKAAIESIPAVSESIATMNTDQLETKADGAFLLLAYLEAENPEPTAQLDDTNLVLTVQAATTRLDELDGMKPTPEVLAEKAVLERVVSGAKDDLDSIPDETIAKVQANAYGQSDVDALRRAIDNTHSKTVTLRTQFETIGNAVGSAFGRGKADGGWLAPGRSGGGWVPGPYPGPGIDNVIWPYAPGAAGGRYLGQPLAGDEFVVRGSQARVWGSALEAINAGLMPRDVQPAAQGPLVGSLTLNQLPGEPITSQAQYLSGYLATRFRI